MDNKHTVSGTELPLVANPRMQEVAHEIPSVLYAQVLGILADKLDAHQHVWPICILIFNEALKQLDPYMLGMGIVILHCTPPAPGRPVRSLHAVIGQGQGTPLWSSPITRAKNVFFGAESLSGYAITAGRTAMVEDCQDEHERRLYSNIEGAGSLAVAPILHAGCIAGCLSVASALPRHFDASSLTLLKAYSDLLALICDPATFYKPEQVALSIMPSPAQQRVNEARFWQRVAMLRDEAGKKHQALTPREAETIALQQLEDELLSPIKVQQAIM